MGAWRRVFVSWVPFFVALAGWLLAGCGSQPVDANESDTWVSFTYDVHEVSELSLHVSFDGDYNAYEVDFTRATAEPCAAEGELSKEQLSAIEALLTEENIATYRREANPSNACQAATAHYRVKWHDPEGEHSECWVAREFTFSQTTQLITTLHDLTRQLLYD